VLYDFAMVATSLLDLQRIGGEIGQPSRVSSGKWLPSWLQNARRQRAEMNVVARLHQIVEIVYGLPATASENTTEKEYEIADEGLRKALDVTDELLSSPGDYLEGRRDELAEIRRRLSDARRAISKGYPPAHLPSRAERELLAAARLHDVSSGTPRG